MHFTGILLTECLLLFIVNHSMLSDKIWSYSLLYVTFRNVKNSIRPFCSVFFRFINNKKEISAPQTYYLMRGFGPLPGVPGRPGPPGSGQKVNAHKTSRPMFSPVYKQASAPIQVRKTFPESWIFENVDEIRYF